MGFTVYTSWYPANPYRLVVNLYDFTVLPYGFTAHPISMTAYRPQVCSEHKRERRVTCRDPSRNPTGLRRHQAVMPATCVMLRHTGIGIR
ncbi:hypothetical protein SAMN05216436_10191 [bacterium A37T11]|nr:hypothetical protein SAMN05216436_10191 [bacterium A37T11]